MHIDRNRLKLGAVLSLEHATRLIIDAACLFSQRSYSTAFVLTVFAREELGRANLLWARYSKMSDSEFVASEELKDQLENHLARLDAGQMTTHVQLTQKEIEMLSTSASSVGSEKYNSAFSEIRRRTKRVRKHDPGNLHQRRLKAQYVDIRSDGTWSRPVEEATKTDAKNLGLTVSSEVIGTILQMKESEDIQVVVEDSAIQLPDWSNLQQSLLVAFCETDA
jgi:AbiV family abortive infection protein